MAQERIEAKSYRDNPLSKLVLGILRYDSGRGASWRDEGGNLWAFTMLR